MKPIAKKKTYKKLFLIISLCFLVLWAVLGTGASLAWFTDTTPEINNIFHTAQFDLTVSHRLTDGKWETVDSQTKLFDEEALYEPGYTQVVYLKVENEGDIPFTFYTSVNVNGCTVATNALGHPFALQDYLRFGITVADSESAMKNSIPDREAAKLIADKKLHNYDTQTAVLAPNGTAYIALVVRMPEDVDNVANHRGDPKPKVELGITVKADQITA